MQARLIVSAALSLLACSAAFAHIEIYQATLSGLNENPPNASPATGFTTVTLDLDLITMRVQADFEGLLGNTTASHIHVRAPGVANGGVATQLPTFVGFPLGVTSGSYDNTFDMAQASSWNPAFITANGGTVSSALNAFVLALHEDRAYLNIHTNLFPGGEIRGNLALVPEPASLSVLGLSLLAFFRKRRK